MSREFSQMRGMRLELVLGPEQMVEEDKVEVFMTQIKHLQAQMAGARLVKSRKSG